jgi:hypothetical protein
MIKEELFCRFSANFTFCLLGRLTKSVPDKIVGRKKGQTLDSPADPWNRKLGQIPTKHK